MDGEIQKASQAEISATTRWGIGLLLALMVQTGAVFFWAAKLEAEVTRHTQDIAVLQTDVKDIDKDIRDILLGIEQVKARLGIVEVTDTSGR